MNIKKSLNNVIWGIFSQAVIIGMGLVVPRIILVNYGSDTNGLTSTVRQIFIYMALLEAGIGQSTLNSLYGPVTEKNREKISSIMSASIRYYRKVTLLYAALVFTMAVIMPFALKTQIAYGTVFLIIIFEGASSVIGFYYLEAWKQLLSADGYYYITQNITMLSTILSYGVKIVLACMGVNIAVIQAAYFLLSLAQMMVYKIYLKRNYSWVNLHAVPDNSALSDRYAYMLTQISSTVFSSTDAIVLSVFCGTVMASVHSVYGLIYNNLNNLLGAVYFGTVFLLGQKWRTDKAEYVILHDAFDGISMWMITSTMSVAYILTLPFVSLYTQGISDVNYIYELLPLLFSLIQIISWSRYVSGNLTGIAGYAKVVSKISCIEALINLSLSIILAIKFGIVGTLVATVMALPVKVIYCLILTNHKILNRSIWKSVKILLVNYILFGMTVLFQKRISLNINGFGSFIIYGLLIAVLVYPLFFACNFLSNYAVRLYVKDTIINIIEMTKIRSNRS